MTGCVVEEKIDYPGYDIKMEIVANQEECAKLCATTVGAHFWTYHDEVKKCWVKTSNSVKVSDDRFVSGNRGCGL